MVGFIGLEVWVTYHQWSVECDKNPYKMSLRFYCSLQIDNSDYYLEFRNTLHNFEPKCVGQVFKLSRLFVYF